MTRTRRGPCAKYSRARWVIETFLPLYPLAILFAVTMTNAMPGARTEPTTVSYVDLERYAGKWYEIARYPNRFQRDCAADTSATYALRADGKLAVINECRSPQGKIKRAAGTATVTDKKSNSKLKVTFFWPFYGKYWILECAPDYEYAVVGEPSRKYLWILSRKPQMEEALFQRLAERVADQGYDPAKLVRTPQSER